jgi:hypothetical protein
MGLTSADPFFETPNGGKRDPLFWEAVPRVFDARIDIAAMVCPEQWEDRLQ